MMTSCFTPEQINKINSLVREIEELTDVEKLFLYLQLPCGLAGIGDEVEVRSKSNNLPPRLNGTIFTRKLDQETTQTYTWILSHLEVDQNVSLPKQEVYDEYKSFCQANGFEPLCVADFGKAMKHTFPCIKPRRLGHRGNSRYCYSGLRKKYRIMPPSWPEMTENPTISSCTDTTGIQQLASQIIQESSGNCSTVGHTVKPETCTTEVRKLDDSSSHYNKNGIKMLEDSSNQKQRVETNHTQMSINQDIEINNRMPPVLTNEASVCSGINNMSSALRNEQMFPCNQPYFNYNYPQTIHQPGTPDDDDYQHNYQHKEGLMSRQFMSQPAPVSSVPAATSVSCSNHLCQKQQPQQSQPNAHQNDIPVGYSRVKPINSSNNTMIPTSTVPHHQAHDPMLSQPNFCLDNPGVSSSSSMSTNAMTTYMNLTRFNGAPHMDSNGSPFQSPASTPYPSTSSNYMNHDSQDYFACDPIHYTST